jgi:hypothetical protein
LVGVGFVVFMGGGTPLVVRRCGGVGCWMLVGEAYVSGLMDGMDVEGREIQDFRQV